MGIIPKITSQKDISTLGLSALLLSITALCYWPSLNYLFVYDDYGYVVSNFKLSQGITRETLKWAFTTFDQANWHPLTWIFYLVEFQYFGLDPIGYHIINIILHAANVILFFLILKALSSSSSRSFFASLIFCVHPTHIESVVWISELKDVLSCFFWMIAMIAYFSYTRKKNFWTYVATFISIALGLMVKPMLVTLPFVFILLDAWPLGRLQVAQTDETPFWKVFFNLFRPSQSSLYVLLIEKIPFFLLVIMSSVMTFIAQRDGGAVASLQHLPLFERFGNAIISYITYLYHFIWPVSLAFHYPHPGSWPLLETLCCSAILICISIAAIILRKTFPYLLFGWLWYLGTLVPTIGIVQVGTQALADRYLYIPSIGICIALVWGFVDLVNRIYHGRLILISLGCSIIFMLMIAHVSYLKYWSDEISLYTHGIKITGPHYVAMHNLGYIYLLLDELDKSQEYLEQAIAFSPNSFKAHNNLGLVFAKRKQYDKARSEFLTTAQINPQGATPYINLANIEFDLSDFQKAIIYLQKALELEPDSPVAHGNLAFVYYSKGEYDKAEFHYLKALEIYPKYYTAMYRLSLLELKRQHWTKALQYSEKSIALDPTSFEAWNNKGTAYMGLKDYSKAKSAFEKALELKSDFKPAIDNLSALHNQYDTGEQRPENL